MILLLDADALIKLHWASVLARVTQGFTCLIPDAVYHEVVTRGRERGYPDAEEIDRIVKSGIEVRSTTTVEELENLGLGLGETSALALAAQQEEDCFIVTDDRQFRGLLMRQGTPFLVPASLIVTMARQRFFDTSEAKEILERIKPIIRETDYQLAMQDLEKG